jgi:molecular chaperone HtpG
MERLAVLEQGALSDGAHAAEMGRVSLAIARMQKVVDSEAVEENLKEGMMATVADIEAQIAHLGGRAGVDPFDMIPPSERETYRQVINLIYECSANRVAAKSLVDKIIQRLAA